MLILSSSELLSLIRSLLLYLIRTVYSLGTSCFSSRNFNSVTSLLSRLTEISSGMNSTGIEAPILFMDKSIVCSRGSMQCSRLNTSHILFWDRFRFLKFSASIRGAVAISFFWMFRSTRKSSRESAREDISERWLKLKFRVYKAGCLTIRGSDPEILLWDRSKNLSFGA